jgi:hypothetical protein
MREIRNTPDVANGNPSPAWVARCDECLARDGGFVWRCHDRPHRNKEVAQRCLDRHTVAHHEPHSRAVWQGMSVPVRDR